MRTPYFIGALFAAAIALAIPMSASAAEEPPHTIVTEDGNIEVREYAPQIVAEVTVTGDMRRAGNSGFRPLANFIFGNNTARQSIDMTAPVTRTETGSGDWVVAFVMPEDWTMETLPEPNNPDVTLREVPGEMIAAIRFNGTGRESVMMRKQDQLETWLSDNGYVATGPARYAGYDAPWVPAPMKRNEVMIPVARAES